MKAALLVCDHVPEELVPEHGTYPEMFGRLMNMPLHNYYVCDGHFPSVDDYDLFVCTGSKYSVYDDLPWVQKLKKLTRAIYESGKKYVGVCYGHQVIAESLGGKVQRSEKGYMIGVHQFTITKRKPWMKPYEPEFNVLMLCQDQVVQLPPGAEKLAESPECKIGMFTLDDRFLAIQGHPEFTPEFNKALFIPRLEKTAGDKVQQALISLNLEPDSTKLAGYIHHFLTQT